MFNLRYVTVLTAPDLACTYLHEYVIVVEQVDLVKLGRCRIFAGDKGAEMIRCASDSWRFCGSDVKGA